MNIDKFISEMKRQKKRITPARKQIFEIVSTAPSPVSAESLVMDIGVNKTTIYRDLGLFIQIGLVKDVDFGDGIKRYEIKDSGHHHHLICMQCKKVSDVKIEEKFEVPATFRVLKHSLEFFGYCQNCFK